MGARRELAEAEAAHVRETAAGMTERQRRLYLGSVSLSHGPGWDSAVARASGASRSTVARGRREYEAGERWERGGRDRAAGAGRPSASELFANRGTDLLGSERDLTHAVAGILGGRSYGDPTGETPVHSSLTAASVAAAVWLLYDFRMSERTALRICHEAGFSMQRNAKQDQVGERHPLRNALFLVRDEVLRAFKLLGLPILSCDTKAKPKLGNLAADGREWRPKGDPRSTLDHDFVVTYAELYAAIYPNGHPLLAPSLAGRNAVASPYGVYDVVDNSAHVTIGAGSDTSEFACAAIKAWWEARGRRLYHGTDELLILVDGGGSNRAAGWLYKYELALMLLRCGLKAVTVIHHAPGTSKYNPIEHRLWPHVGATWRGMPLMTLEEMAELVGQATTSKGLEVSCGIDYNDYPTEARRRRERPEGAPQPPGYQERFEAIARIERPFANKTLSQWCYRIELLSA